MKRPIQSSISRGVFCGVLLAGCVLGGARPVLAQRYKVLPGPNDPRRATNRLKQRLAEQSQSKQSNTVLSVELVGGMDGVGFQAQMWRPIFEQMGVDVRIRTGNLSEKPEIKEDKVGTFRRVTVIGRLDRQGRIVLPDKVFSQDQTANLSKYLEDLKKFGKQGNPAGQPLWGLNQEQFAEIYKAFSEKIDKPIKDQSLEKAIDRLDIPANYPVRMTQDASDWLKSEFPNRGPFPQSLEGFSRGTALAMLLNEYGLGFRPVRTPAGKLEISVVPLQKTTEVWPVGWQLRNSRQQTAPSLFEFVPVDLDNLPIVDVLTAISAKTKIPIRYDHYRIEANGIDLVKTRVNYPPRKTSWSLLLRGVTNPNRLSHDLKIDELGQPFVWITTLKFGKLGKLGD